MCEEINFTINGECEIFKIKNAVAVSRLCLLSQTLSREHVRYLAKTQSIFMQPYSNARPELLIDKDNWRLITTTETRAGEVGQLAVSRTPLG